MWWMAGELDGDGSVGIYAGRLKVAIKKSVKSKTTLQHIQQLFGGDLHYCPAAKDTWEDQVFWTLHAEPARAFCSKIAPYVFLKRAQFEVAASITVGRTPAVACKEGREVSVQNGTELHLLISDPAVLIWTVRRRMAKAGGTPFQLGGWTVTCKPRLEVKKATQRAAEQLRELKQKEHDAITGPLPPPPYFCGFFEADGCVTLTGPNASVSVSQKYRSICDLLQAIYGGRVSRAEMEAATLGHMWRWAAHSKSARKFLEDVYAHAFEKREQMHLALSATKANWRKNKLEMDAMKGARKKKKQNAL